MPLGPKGMRKKAVKDYQKKLSSTLNKKASFKGNLRFTGGQQASILARGDIGGELQVNPVLLSRKLSIFVDKDARQNTIIRTKGIRAKT